MSDGTAGSFFNKVPDKDDDDDDDEKKEPQTPPPPPSSNAMDVNIVQESSLKPDGMKISSTAAKGFGSVNLKATKKKPYTALGPPDRQINDVTKPETDKDGYTLYENEKTGEKKRVFDALVEYPCKFSLKVVGAKEGSFIQDIVQIVADSCNVKVDDISYTTRDKGKWVSITLKAPVDSAEMLYQLYEDVDKDSRVKFKF